MVLQAPPPTPPTPHHRSHMYFHGVEGRCQAQIYGQIRVCSILFYIPQISKGTGGLNVVPRHIRSHYISLLGKDLNVHNIFSILLQ